MAETSSEEADRRLRRAGPQDAAAVRALTRAAYAKWVPLIGREPKPMTADYDHAVVAHRIDLMYRNGDLVALIETILHPDHLLIENLAVAPAAQGQGHGRFLLGHAEALAVDAGHDLLRLYTNRLFAANIALYARHGYALEREEAVASGTVVHMSKRLALPAARPGAPCAGPDR
ncbi:MAG: GNAT family N-acetyltransferase [Sneathiellaceae bacterium]